MLIRTNLLLVLGLFIGAVILAQSGDEETHTIRLDTPLVAYLDGEQPILLTYIAENVETVTITARSLEESGLVDTVVELLDAEGQRLAYGDDWAESSDTRIENLTLPGAGAYTLCVDSFNGVSSGDVEITVRASNAFGEVVTSDGEDEIVTATLPANGRFVYSFEAEMGEAVTITVRDTSGTLDPLVRLISDDGALLVENDDHDTDDLSLDSFDARIAAFTIPETGTYHVEVVDFTGAAGRFELTITREIP